MLRLTGSRFPWISQRALTNSAVTRHILPHDLCRIFDTQFEQQHKTSKEYQTLGVLDTAKKNFSQNVF